MRPSGRSPDQMRSVTLETGFSSYAEGSCLAKFGDTHVLCNATVEERVPPWMRNSGRGWVTAEYGMLPRSTHERTDREAARGKQSGRTQEIQRLIGRSLRAVVDLEALGERQVRLDCDHHPCRCAAAVVESLRACRHRRRQGVAYRTGFDRCRRRWRGPGWPARHVQFVGVNGCCAGLRVFDAKASAGDRRDPQW